MDIYQLGKKPVRRDMRTLRLADYVTPRIPTPPASVASPIAGDWSMLANDKHGDCTIVAAAHLIMSWEAANKASILIPSDQQVLQDYATITGFDLKTGANDNGAVELDVLNYWRKTGICGHRIHSYMQISAHDHIAQTKLGVYLFGGVYTGFALPKSVQGKNSWDWQGNYGGDNEPGSWGGHAVPVVAYDASNAYVVTWGGLLPVSWDFYSHYCEEAYVVSSPDFVDSTHKSPQGFDMETLLSDLNLINQVT